jgi:hypothetical protein
MDANGVRFCSPSRSVCCRRFCQDEQTCCYLYTALCLSTNRTAKKGEKLGKEKAFIVDSEIAAYMGLPTYVRRPYCASIPRLSSPLFRPILLAAILSTPILNLGAPALSSCTDFYAG